MFQQLSESEKEALVRKFSSESGLNLKWTLECLNANNWDYQTSAIDFQRAKVNTLSVYSNFATPLWRRVANNANFRY